MSLLPSSCTLFRLHLSHSIFRVAGFLRSITPPDRVDPSKIVALSPSCLLDGSCAPVNPSRGRLVPRARRPEQPRLIAAVCFGFVQVNEEVFRAPRVQARLSCLTETAHLRVNFIHSRANSVVSNIRSRHNLGTVGAVKRPHVERPIEQPWDARSLVPANDQLGLNRERDRR